MTRPIRFGFQISGDHAADPIAAARRAEELGFDVVTVSDHVGPPRMSPMTTLAAIAASTSRIRLGTFVLNNDMRNPVQLAWEAVTLDRLSGGRFELGLGAGHTPHEYSATGLAFDPPAVRKARLIEGVRVIRRLVDGETVDFEGEHVRVSGAEVGRSTQERLPVLVGGNGARLLGAAGELADIVGLAGPRTHARRWPSATTSTGRQPTSTDRSTRSAPARRPVRRPRVQRTRAGVHDHRRPRQRRSPRRASGPATWSTPTPPRSRTCSSDRSTRSSPTSTCAANVGASPTSSFEPSTTSPPCSTRSPDHDPPSGDVHGTARQATPTDGRHAVSVDAVMVGRRRRESRSSRVMRRLRRRCRCRFGWFVLRVFVVVVVGFVVGFGSWSRGRSGWCRRVGSR